MGAWLKGVLGAALGLLVLAPCASAATIVVNSDLDTNPAADSTCTLREAVFVANTNEPTGGRGIGNLGCAADNAPDTIQLVGGHIYALSQGFAIEDGNVWGDLDIAGPTTIRTVGTGMATILGNGTDPQVNERDRVLHVLSTAGDVRLEGVKIQGGWVNSGVGGGGVLADAPLTVTGSEVTGNRVQAPGSTFGGGIYVRGPIGTLTISSSTIAGNVAQVVASPGDDQTIGAGIAVFNAAPSVSITNSTISGNQSIGVNAVGPGLAGGAFLGDGTAAGTPVTTLTRNTITLNQATLGGALSGGLQVGGGTLTGNIVAGNVADNSAQDCFGFPDASGGGNIIGKQEDPWCQLEGPGDLLGTNAVPVLTNLGTLVDNGGPTRSHLPNTGSPAIDRGGPCPATDQRGLFRYISLPCDAGSVEVGATSTPPPVVLTPAVPVTPATQATGQRAAALKKCKKVKSKKARKKCRAKAQKLPV